jgi:D-3-phosphoglycerate dehydrogenase
VSDLRVAITDYPFGEPDLERRLLAECGHELVHVGDLRDPDDIVRVAGEADALLNCYAQIPAAVIDGLARCRIIARFGIGLDTIDVDAATSRGIVVTNVPDYCQDEVAEHTLALLLALVRGLPRLGARVSAGGWSATEAVPVHRVRGSVLGLVGFGSIGQAVAQRARGLGMRVVAFDPGVGPERFAQAGVQRADLDEVLASADFVSLHLPLTPGTRHIIGPEALSRMKPSAMLINTSRGGLVDTGALRAALAAERLAGAALDVLEEEPPPAADPLRSDDRVILTPHVAFYSEESLEELKRKVVGQVVLALAGQTPPYAVNAERAAVAARALR